MTDIKNFGVRCRAENADELFAASVLCEELARRTGIRFEPEAEGAIELAIDPELSPFPEGYAFRASDGSVLIASRDRIGLIHGIGHLLRTCAWRSGGLSVADESIESHPHKPLRGSQIGYRPKTNAYSAMTKAMFGQYIRDLALFGASAVEFLPPRTDDEERVPCMLYDQTDMLVFASTTAHELGLKVWLWYPNLNKNETGLRIPASGFLDETSDEARELNKTLRFEDAQREYDFAHIPYLDEIIIPAADPGDLVPEDLFAMSERMANIMRRHHPNAGVWVSAQIMKANDDFKRRFYAQVERRPAWLKGICHAPWVSHLVEECRALTPAELPIRSYPDVCHLLSSQYPAHNWDPIWALTAGRECYCPRPRWHRRVHELTTACDVGNLLYSEGIADDPNKFIWLDLDWSRDIPTARTLRDFASMFVSPAHADELGALIASFEDVMDGPAVSNETVASLYRSLKALECKLRSESFQPGFGADSYRFLMPRLMSTFYMLIQLRARRDSAAYASAWDGLSFDDADSVAAELKRRLEVVYTNPSPELTCELRQLADACWDATAWKTDSARHFAQNTGRGGFLDTINIPLCDAPWLAARLERISGISGVAAKLDYIRSLRDRRVTAPGGKYICASDPASLRCLQMGKSWWDEPGALTIPRIEHWVGTISPQKLAGPISAFADTPIERTASFCAYYGASVALVIDGLIPSARYELKLVYPLRFGWRGQPNIEGYVEACGARLEHIGNVPGDESVYIYDVPAGTVDACGVLRLTIGKDEGPRGSGMTELWLEPVL